MRLSVFFDIFNDKRDENVLFKLCRDECLVWRIDMFICIGGLYEFRIRIV